MNAVEIEQQIHAYGTDRRDYRAYSGSLNAHFGRAGYTKNKHIAKRNIECYAAKIT